MIAYFNCDWHTMLEDGGIGGVLMAVVWGIVSWYKRHSQSQQQSGTK